MRSEIRARELRALFATLAVILACIATAHLAVYRGNELGETLVVGAMVIALVGRARTLLLAGTGLVLVAGSVPSAVVKEAAFYLRFVFLGGLTIANLLHARRFQVDRRLRGVSWALGLLAAWAVLSVLWSVDSSVTSQRALAFLLLATAVVSTALFSWTNASTVRHDLAVLAAVLGTAITASLVALIAGAEWASVGGRFRGILENPNTLGLCSGLLVPLSIGLAHSARGRLDRWAWSGISFVTALLLVLTQSRNGMLSALLGLFVLVLGRSGIITGRPRVDILAGALVVTLVATFLATRIEPVEQAIRSYVERGSSGRLVAWRLAWDLARERPLYGWGFGTTEQVFGSRAVLLRAAFQGELVHNGYLQLVLELGPIALVLALAAIGTALLVGIEGSRDVFSCAVFGAFCGGSLMQLAESGITSAGSIFALNFWLVTMATVKLRSTGIVVTASGTAHQAEPSRRQIGSPQGGHSLERD